MLPPLLSELDKVGYFKDKDVITSSPKVEIDSGSNSNNSMDHYFPDQTQMNIPSTSNIDNYQVETQPENLNVPNTSQVGLSPLLEKVKSLFTPKTENKTLEKQPSVSNLLEDTNALFDDIENDLDNSNLITNIPSSPNISWDNIEINLLNNTNITINFKDIWRVAKTIHFATTEGHTFYYNSDELNLGNLNNQILTFDITDKIPNILKDFPNVKIKEVLIEDLNSNFNSIFKN